MTEGSFFLKKNFIHFAKEINNKPNNNKKSPALPQEPVEKDDYKTIATLRVDIMEGI